jgi:DNA-binding CsgD family transcriptional regulator
MGFRPGAPGRRFRLVSPELAKHHRQFERLAGSELNLATLPDQLLDALARAVPFDAFCWGALDPGSLLPTRATGTTIPAGSPLLWEVQDVVAHEAATNTIRAQVRAGRPVSLLSNDLEPGKQGSPIYQRILRPNGLEHQLRAALVADGCCWGFLQIERRPDRPDFCSGEVALIEALVPHLAHVFRRWLLADAEGTHRQTALPGVIVFDEDNEVDSISPEAEHWLTEWSVPDPAAHPPAAIAAVVAATRARAEGVGEDVAPSARLRLPSGTWLQVRATLLTRPRGGACTAVVLEPAAAEQVAPLVARANQLTARETEVAVLVLRGLSTAEIAARLFISPYTVQDHLKAIFEKVGVRSRRELATEIFEPHFQTVA